MSSDENLSDPSDVSELSESDLLENVQYTEKPKKPTVKLPYQTTVKSTNSQTVFSEIERKLYYDNVKGKNATSGYKSSFDLFMNDKFISKFIEAKEIKKNKIKISEFNYRDKRIEEKRKLELKATAERLVERSYSQATNNKTVDVNLFIKRQERHLENTNRNRLRNEEQKLINEIKELRSKPLMTERSVSLAKKKRNNSAGSVHERLFSTPLNRSIDKEASPEKVMSSFEIDYLVNRLNDDAFERREKRQEMQDVNYQKDLISESTKVLVLRQLRRDEERTKKVIGKTSEINFEEFKSILNEMCFLSNTKPEEKTNKLLTKSQNETQLVERAWKMVSKRGLTDLETIFNFLCHLAGVAKINKLTARSGFKTASIDTNFTTFDTMRGRNKHESGDNFDYNHSQYVKRTFTLLFSNWIDNKRKKRRMTKSVDLPKSEYTFKPQIYSQVRDRNFGMPRAEFLFNTKYLKREKEILKAEAEKEEELKKLTFSPEIKKKRRNEGDVFAKLHNQSVERNKRRAESAVEEEKSVDQTVYKPQINKTE